MGAQERKETRRRKIASLGRSSTPPLSSLLSMHATRAPPGRPHTRSFVRVASASVGCASAHRLTPPASPPSPHRAPRRAPSPAPSSSAGSSRTQGWCRTPPPAARPVSPVTARRPAAISLIRVPGAAVRRASAFLGAYCSRPMREVHAIPTEPWSAATCGGIRTSCAAKASR